MIKISIRFVNGSLQEYPESKELLSRLTKLQKQGY